MVADSWHAGWIRSCGYSRSACSAVFHLSCRPSLAQIGPVAVRRCCAYPFAAPYLPPGVRKCWRLSASGRISPGDSMRSRLRLAVDAKRTPQAISFASEDGFALCPAQPSPGEAGAQQPSGRVAADADPLRGDLPGSCRAFAAGRRGLSILSCIPTASIRSAAGAGRGGLAGVRRLAWLSYCGQWFSSCGVFSACSTNCPSAHCVTAKALQNEATCLACSTLLLKLSAGRVDARRSAEVEILRLQILRNSACGIWFLLRHLCRPGLAIRRVADFRRVFTSTSIICWVACGGPE